MCLFLVTYKEKAPLAQLVEQWPFKPLVVSSSLTRITNINPRVRLEGFWFMNYKGALLFLSFSTKRTQYNPLYMSVKKISPL